MLMKLSDLSKELIVGTAILPMLIGGVFASNNVILDIGQYSDIGGNNCTVNSDLSFDCSNTDNVIVGTDSGWLKRSSSYFWTNSGLAYYGYKNSDQTTAQGYVSKFKYCGENGNPLSSCNSASNVSYDSFIEYYNSHNLTNWMWYSTQSSEGMAGVSFIFGNSYFVFAPETASTYVGVLSPYNFGLSGWGKDANYGSVGVIDSIIPKPTQYYSSTGSCPSVGQIKHSSNLNPAICYAGYNGDLIYTAGENTIIWAGSGLNIFETYALLSGQMNIQNWYDTYWAYYNNISFNPYPFYNKPKALLGLMVARQMGSIHQCGGSYSILNYCWYVLNDFPDNSNTCLVPNILSQYPGINITSEDTQCIVDSINDDYNVHIPSTGSIFDRAPDGGGTSWGDDECKGIPCLFDKFYQMFTSSRINDVDFSEGGQGILPGYIALAFVVVVLFYVFKR